MTDREMLELAAKAAGIQGKYSTGVIWYKNPFGDEAGFNPLNDDGDALRLAVKLGLDIQQFCESGRCEAWKHPNESCSEDYGSDADAATRRAIVRAAAELGRYMP